MNILLWIALAGVIVFLLMLYFSRRDQQAIQSATAPSTTPSPVKKSAAGTVETELHSAAAPQDRATSEIPVAEPVIAAAIASENANAAHVKTALAPQPAQSHTEHQTAHGTYAVTPPSTLAATPAAEPVGPGFATHAHSESEVSTKDIKKPAKAVASAPAETEQPSVQPLILKAPRRSKPDNLTLITGIGKALQEKLFKSGIFHFEQLATLTALQTDWVNQQIGFAGRVERENWIAQAKKLSTQAAQPVVDKPKATAKIPAKAKAKAKPKPATTTATTTATAIKAKPAARKKPAAKS